MSDDKDFGLANWILHVNERLQMQDQHLIKMTNQINENTMMINNLRAQLDALSGMNEHKLH